jgi:hypothetical protein
VLSLANPKIAKGKGHFDNNQSFQKTYIFKDIKGKKYAQYEPYLTKNQGAIPLAKDKRKTLKVKCPY